MLNYKISGKNLLKTKIEQTLNVFIAYVIKYCLKIHGNVYFLRGDSNVFLLICMRVKAYF